MSNIALAQDQKQVVEMVRVLFPHLQDVSDVEVAKAIATARHLGLDPLRREVHFVPFKGRVQLVVGYLEYIKRAERSGKLNGWQVNVNGDTARVVIYRKDWDHPFEWEVSLQEVQKDTPTWKQMPQFMLKKVAISQAFRLCFPEELGHMPYTEGEVEEDYVEPERQEQEREVRKITEAQQKKIRVLLKDLGLKDRNEILSLISNIVGREIESSQDLTLQEASLVIDALTQELQNRQEVEQ
ncbi:RecT family recombinase [Pampinifervens florentissimum]|uniref:RecT family recombinase n=1 Tax=Pampinifervens florentissimum TaxID=1632019 RepID=UPI0013B49794|nr:RecT family recombinase [Hydrogenobacter sp. T-8]QID32302.1 recombinase RecT [Hydrogenobacter sp. T-8]